MQLTFTLNGSSVTVDADPSLSLLTLLRDQFALTGVKQACDMEGECGACTVIIDGVAQRACLLLAGEMEGRTVQTVEGLAAGGNAHPLQTAFLAVGAVQCGYCTPGMLMSAKALLDRTWDPTREEIIAALAGNFCRCTGYVKIIAAVEQAAAMLRGATPPALLNAFTRHNGLSKVNGAARFAGDIPLPGLHHLAFVRSPHPHARVLAIDAAAVRVAPGIAAVLTAEDVPGDNANLGGYSVGEHLLVPVGDTVRMVGDALALVVGISREAAEAGAAAVQVRYDVLAHRYNVTPEARVAAPVPAPAGGDILAQDELHTGDVSAALQAADVRCAAVYTTPYQAHMATEREAGVAYWEDAQGELLVGAGLAANPAARLVVVYGGHNPHWVLGYLATILALPRERLRVITPPTGGSFGGRQDMYPPAAVALATYHTGQPVRLEYSRREVMEAAPKRHPYTIHAEAGVRGSTDGPILTGLRIDMDVNTGAYDSAGRYIPGYAIAASPGPYRWEAVEANARTIYSNGPKAGQFRGFGTPQPVFAVECLLDELCERTGADPLAFRLRNALFDGEPTGLGFPTGETLGYREVLQALRSDYDEISARVATFNARPSHPALRRGVGVAGMMYRFGKFGVARSQAEVMLDRDGGFTVYASAGEYGQGIETTFLIQAATALGVSGARIRLVNGDTAMTLDGDVAGASRAAYWVGSAISDAARRLRGAILGLAAELLDAPPDALVLVSDGVSTVHAPGHRLPLAEIAAEMDRAGLPRRVRGSLDLSQHYPDERESEYLPFFLTAAHVAEVEVDLATGAAKVKTIAAAHDVGHILNRRDAEGQVEGGVVMGLGSALIEEFIPDVSRGFATYAAPTITATPEIRVHLVEQPGRHAAQGIKGLGEATLLATPPAIINALSRAVGARIRTLPATPERVMAAIGQLSASSG